jgi:TldD protein
MKRRDFMQMSGMGIGALMLPSVPVIGNPVAAEHLLESWIDAAAKKKLSEIALNAASSKGATYTDVRIGRYLQQYLFTREKQVQNIVNAESYGIGIRVIANGTWGFSATSDVTPEGIAKCAATAVEIAKANSKFQKEPVVLAEQKGVGEKTWKTPLKKNALKYLSGKRSTC